ncbi:hypothetical protein [Rhodococcus sp. SORGH_AS_0301]|uniref:hypothetical protein n=1 Tax=Rhodococcus sp. SORGH_AS_0301 TaxID=3041780 RepID=UPI0027829202|nr:hypothetical protein [Rhodococcus sp. SORGH_AS_0301]MDQ1178568.1 hypothetical protein [Rhodococcus sp. SORGH_AS_0301]
MVDIWRYVGGTIAKHRFDWAPGKLVTQANHCLELPFLFEADWTDAPMLAGEQPPQPLIGAKLRNWSSFARHDLAGLDSTSIVFV